MASFAVIKTGGKQYLVKPGEKLKIEKLDVADGGNNISFDEVLLVADGTNVAVGTPHVSGARVEATVTAQGRNRKQIVFKYHAKARYRKKKGHRQSFTEIEIKRIVSK